MSANEKQILDALNTIKSVCAEHEVCDYCPFAEDYGGESCVVRCKVIERSPQSWNIQDKEITIWRAFK